MKDELSEATNWSRAFHKVHQELKWLNSFAIINQVACEEFVEQLIQAFFETKVDNLIGQGLQLLISEKQFVMKIELTELFGELLNSYAENFTKGDLEAAKIKLRGQQ